MSEPPDHTSTVFALHRRPFVHLGRLLVIAVVAAVLLEIRATQPRALPDPLDEQYALLEDLSERRSWDPLVRNGIAFVQRSWLFRDRTDSKCTRSARSKLPPLPVPADETSYSSAFSLAEELLYFDEQEMERRLISEIIPACDYAPTPPWGDYRYHLALGREYLSRGDLEQGLFWLRGYRKRLDGYYETGHAYFSDPDYILRAWLQEPLFSESRQAETVEAHALESDLDWILSGLTDKRTAARVANQQGIFSHFGRFMVAAHDFVDGDRPAAYASLNALRAEDHSQAFQDLVWHLILQAQALDLIYGATDVLCSESETLTQWSESADSYLASDWTILKDEVRWYQRAIKTEQAHSCGSEL